MEGEKFQIRSDWEKLNKEELSLYIYELHNYLCAFEVSSVKQLLISLDGVAQKICDDLDSIADGDIENLKILNPDKGDAVFDRVMKIIEKVDSFKKISSLAESLRPEIVKLSGDVKDNNSKSVGNVFEQALEKIKNGRG
jgi:hypothetical protein